MDRMNPFRSLNIIQILSKSCSPSDKETLKKLRQSSTLYYNILKKPFFDLLQVKLYVDMDADGDNIMYHFPSGFQRKLKLKKWDPLIAQTIRVLEFKVQNNKKYADSTPSSLENMDIYHFLFNQLFPYVTTLKLTFLTQSEDPIKLLNFIKQFINLKHLSLQTYYRIPEESVNDHLKPFLSTLQSSLPGIKVELRLNYMELEEIENFILAPENGIMNLIDRLGFDSPGISNEQELERFAQLITENQSIITDIEFWLGKWNLLAHVNETNAENILGHLRVISPFVSDLSWSACNTTCDIDLFTSVRWPNLTRLCLGDYTKQLPDLSIPCPKLHTLRIGSKEDKIFFSNSVTTLQVQQQALEHIFSGCANSLKKLTIVHNLPEDFDSKMYPSSSLHHHLQQLLRKTKVEITMSSRLKFSFLATMNKERFSLYKI